MDGLEIADLMFLARKGLQDCRSPQHQNYPS